ncbi:upf0505 protein c16orf62 like protein, partial [Quercus suber]
MLDFSYLELALLPCWRFLVDKPEDSVQRLVMMTRGLADPLASAYCRLYMAHCAQKLPSCDIGNVLVEFGLGMNQVELFGSFSCLSIVLHHLLKELPAEVVTSSAVEILHTIECSNDYSFDQCLNYRLLGFRLSERKSRRDIVHAVVDKVTQVMSERNSLDEYLKVVDAYVDIVLQNQMDNHLNTILGGISKRAYNKVVTEDELASLQSILVKLLTHFKVVEDVFTLNHFLEILDIMYGSSRSIVNMHILNMATRNGSISDPTSIQLLFEISQNLHDDGDFLNTKDDDNQPARLISHFVHM